MLDKHHDDLINWLDERDKSIRKLNLKNWKRITPVDVLSAYDKLAEFVTPIRGHYLSISMNTNVPICMCPLMAVAFAEEESKPRTRLDVITAPTVQSGCDDERRKRIGQILNLPDRYVIGFEMGFDHYDVPYQDTFDVASFGFADGCVTREVMSTLYPHYVGTLE